MNTLGSFIRNDMKRAAIFFGGLIILILAIFVLFPRQKDKSITENLEAKVVPFLIQNDIKFFSV